MPFDEVLLIQFLEQNIWKNDCVRLAARCHGWLASVSVCFLVLKPTRMLIRWLKHSVTKGNARISNNIKKNDIQSKNRTKITTIVIDNNKNSNNEKEGGKTDVVLSRVGDAEQTTKWTETRDEVTDTNKFLFQTCGLFCLPTTPKSTNVTCTFSFKKNI